MKIKISDIKDAFETFEELGNTNCYKPEGYYLVFSRNCWESELFKINRYSFSKEELDAAEKLDFKLIGVKNGVKCYLPNTYTNKDLYEPGIN
jgi:predicted secreted protein